VRKIAVLLLGASALLAAACGTSADATAGIATNTVAQTATAPVVVAETANAGPATVEPNASLEDARRLAASIAKEATTRMFTETNWSRAGDEPTAQELWIEGDALEWNGELVLWFHAQSIFDEHFMYDISSYSDFLFTGSTEATKLSYERRDEAHFSRVYISFTLKGTATEHYSFDRDALEQSKGDELEDPLFSQVMETGTAGPPPWIAGAK
jgi:hypothetical protein